DYDQQAGSPKKEIHAYASRQPRRQRVGPKHTVNRRADKRKVLKLKSLKQYLRQQRDHRQINGADSRQSRQNLIQMIRRSLARSYARYESAVLAKIVCHLIG